MYIFIAAAAAFLAGIIVNSILRKGVNELIEDTDNFEGTKSTFVRQMKLRYENYIKIGHEINNTEAFACKYLDRYRCHGLSLHAYEKMSAICAGICVVCGICGAISDKNHAMEYLLVGFLAMYIIAGTRRIIDIPEKRKKVTVNIVDFFENRYYTATTEEKKTDEDLTEDVKNDKKTADMSVSSEERKLIDEILREYLG